MAYKVKMTDDGFMLPKAFLDCADKAGESEIRAGLAIFAYLSAKKTDTFTPREVAEFCSLLESEIQDSLGFWRGTGIVKTKRESSKKPILYPERPPVYTPEEIARTADENKEFVNLVDYSQNRLKKIFTPTELSLLKDFTDYMGFSTDVVMLAIEHCVGEGKKSLRYVEKLLMSFADNEIDTYERAEEYIRARQKYKSFEYKIRALLGLGERAFIGKEKTILSSWANEGYDYELIEFAYERMVSNHARPSLAYMDKVLSNWAAAGIRTAKEAKAENQKAIPRQRTQSSFETEDFFAAAVKKSKKSTAKTEEKV